MVMVGVVSGQFQCVGLRFKVLHISPVKWTEAHQSCLASLSPIEQEIQIAVFETHSSTAPGVADCSKCVCNTYSWPTWKHSFCLHFSLLVKWPKNWIILGTMQIGKANDHYDYASFKIQMKKMKPLFCNIHQYGNFNIYSPCSPFLGSVFSTLRLESTAAAWKHTAMNHTQSCTQHKHTHYCSGRIILCR